MMKAAQLFIDDDSGEGWQLIGSIRYLALAKANITAHLLVALDTLLDGEDGDRVTLTIVRKDMTEKEVSRLPEV